MFEIKKMLRVLIFLILLCVAFYIGGIVGFNQGYAYSVFHRSTLEAYFTLRTIENLNAGNTLSAKEQLEGRLDAYITDHYIGLHNTSLISFNKLPKHEEALSKIMGQVAAYRKNHPTKVDDPELKKGIDAVVNRYASK